MAYDVDPNGEIKIGQADTLVDLRNLLNEYKVPLNQATIFVHSVSDKYVILWR